MKIDRLLGIIVYLLNRRIVAARELAEQFEVSPRTIQRDMEHINRAGIPVGSLQGIRGGYFIMDSFKMHRQLLKAEDYAHILTALQGLVSGYPDRRAADTMERMRNLAPASADCPQPFQLDLGVLQEGTHTAEQIALIAQAIRQRTVLQLKYTDTNNRVTDRCVEPLLLKYQWYAWYMFAYCRVREDYRLFRLSRIRGLQAPDVMFAGRHGDPEALLAQRLDRRSYMDIAICCPAELRVRLEEAFPLAHVEETVDGEGECVFHITVPEEEQGWFAILLLFGDRLTVVKPEHLRDRLQAHAAKVMQRQGG